MAFTALGALIAGTAEVTAGLVLAAVAEVGMAMTVVGVVTGSKDLLKIGSVMSLVGGVGGMVNGALGGAAAGGLSEAATTSALESASQEAAGAFGGAAAADAATAGVVAGMEGVAPALAEAGGVASELSGLTSPTSTLGAQANPGSSSIFEAAKAPDLSPSIGPKEIGAPVGAEAPAGAQVQASTAQTTPTAANDPGQYDLRMDANTNPTDMRLQAGQQTAPMDAKSFFGSIGDKLGKFGKFLNENKTLASAGMQLVGGAMKGASDRAMFDEKMALERQRLAQTSFGNQVAHFQPRGIVQGAST